MLECTETPRGGRNTSAFSSHQIIIKTEHVFVSLVLKRNELISTIPYINVHVGIFLLLDYWCSCFRVQKKKTRERQKANKRFDFVSPFPVRQCFFSWRMSHKSVGRNKKFLCEEYCQPAIFYKQMGLLFKTFFEDKLILKNKKIWTAKTLLWFLRPVQTIMVSCYNYRPWRRQHK